MYPVAVETVTIITSLEKYALMERNAEMLGSHMDNRWNTIERVWCWEFIFEKSCVCLKVFTAPESTMRPPATTDMTAQEREPEVA